MLNKRIYKGKEMCTSLNRVHKVESLAKRRNLRYSRCCFKFILNPIGFILYTNIVFSSTYGDNINICLR